MGRLLLLLVALLLVASSAEARVVWPSGNEAHPFSEWLAASAVPSPPGDVTLVIGACPLTVATSASACTGRDQPIYLYPPWLDGHMRRTFLHELGHQFDYRVLDNADRQRMARVMRSPQGVPWFSGGQPSGAEFFAEAYATCALPRTFRQSGVPGGRLWLDFGWRPRISWIKDMCVLIKRAASV